MRTAALVLLSMFMKVVYADLYANDISETLTFAPMTAFTCVFQPLKKNHKLELVVEPEPGIPIAVRVTSPSTRYSEWIDSRNSSNATLQHTVIEDGDYEICLSPSRRTKVSLDIYAYNETAHMEGWEELIQQIRNSANISVFHRDEVQQFAHSKFIVNYVKAFCVSAVIVAIAQVAIIRRMFYINPKRIRI
ncbi:unnamed protein product [Heligmosomoides polygyrus]|uniref:GOLD domain-containing protein n=1 Tax=Heligmosomoides polygyrus TaxID=6339 RepID=A0A183FDW2_HELPZ|nr:unnamed protein product [Heligmosomoides polygyrus]